LADVLNPDLTYLIDSMHVINCPICGSEEYHDVFEGEVARGRIKLRCVICVNCTHLYLNPAPSLEAYARFYESDDYGKIACACKNKPYSQRSTIHDEQIFQARSKYGAMLYNQYFKDELGQGDVVFDFGAGDGAWLYGLRKETGCIVDGNELMGLHVKFIKERLGLDVFQYPIEKIEKPLLEKYNNNVKLVIASDSLEHMVDPMRCLEMARSILAGDGYLYICNWDIIDRMAEPGPGGRLFAEYVSVDHPHYFHENSYRYIVEKAGFEVVHFNVSSEIRPAPKHMEIVARKRQTIKEVVPEKNFEDILGDIASVEFKVKHYRTCSLRYHLHTIKKKVIKTMRKVTAF